jgi:hypothetical protein
MRRPLHLDALSGVRGARGAGGAAGKRMPVDMSQEPRWGYRSLEGLLRCTVAIDKPAGDSLESFVWFYTSLLGVGSWVGVRRSVRRRRRGEGAAARQSIPTRSSLIAQP